MNFGQMKTLTAGWLDDLSYGYFTESQVETWLNNAQKELQKKLLQSGLNYYLKCVQTTLIYGQNEYALPADFHKLHRLEISTGGSAPLDSVYPLGPITLNQQDMVRSGATGDPNYYFLKRSKIVVLPVPATARIMRLFYSYRAVDMALATDIPDAPEQYHEYLPILAAKDGFMKDEKLPQPLMDKLAAFESLMKDDAQDRQVDAPRAVTITEGAGYPDFAIF